MSTPGIRSTPRGCKQCTDGYKGRLGIYQVMPVTETIGRIIMAGRQRHRHRRRGPQGGRLGPAPRGLEKSARGHHQPRRNQQRHHRMSKRPHGQARSPKTTQDASSKQDVAVHLGGHGQARQAHQGQGSRDEAASARTCAGRRHQEGTKPQADHAAHEGRRQGQAEDIALFSRQLATMLAAGIPLVQAFEIVGNGHDKPSVQKLMLDIKADVEAARRCTRRSPSIRCISTTCT
jgi:hypothetical protein